MSYVENLLKTYQKIGTAPPEWAYESQASIPFVGKDYGRWKGLLVYASAENLVHYEKKPDILPEYFKDDRIYNRHRAAFECDTSDNFYRHVHMNPFDTGSLLVAAAHYIWRQHCDQIEDPVELLESIAVANVCKFSISSFKKKQAEQQNGNGTRKGLANIDYAGDAEKLNVSLPFVQADLEHLKPAVRH